MWHRVLVLLYCRGRLPYGRPARQNREQISEFGVPDLRPVHSRANERLNAADRVRRNTDFFLASPVQDDDILSLLKRVGAAIHETDARRVWTSDGVTTASGEARLIGGDVRQRNSLTISEIYLDT